MTIASMIVEKPAVGAMALETLALTKRFGDFTALDQVSIKVQPGSVHALLGENGAGKSTLVKCIAGFHRAEEGSILCDGRERAIESPIQARALGIGMVYQHFTLAPGMTVAENLLLARGTVPTVINWREERALLQTFLATTPFALSLDARPAELAAGEKQKLELLKQLYLKPRLLILDEPTSVLTPQEADEVLGHVRGFARAGQCSVLMITHKFREVAAYADEVTVLRRGRSVMFSRVDQVSSQRLASAMMGGETADAEVPLPAAAAAQAGASTGASARAPMSSTSGANGNKTLARIALEVHELCAQGDRGTRAVDQVSLRVFEGEILGVAGVSGNGQRELVEALVGQRRVASGRVSVMGEPYHGRREENRRLKVRSLPEEPLRNACVAALSVSENMALRDFDVHPWTRFGLLDFARWRQRAREGIAAFGVRTRDENTPMASLSGGNVQRAVLARELSADINVLVVANPVFGLDFAAVREIHTRLREVRNRGGAVLLVSEDLDELIELADRIVVMSEGRLVYETMAQNADRLVIGSHMAGARHAAH